MIKSFLLAAIFVVLMSGCTGVTYSPYTEGTAQTTVFSKNVFYELKDSFYQKAPDCVTILPTKLISSHQTNMYIERSAARHLSEKVGRVIGPLQREHLERSLGLDLSQQQDRKTFLRQTRCTHFLQPTLAELHEEFSVVWSNKAIDLELTLHGVAKDDVLWRASHKNTRSAGGLPLSPLSLGSAVLRAGQAHASPGALPSMVDDSLRRMMKTLPDIRSYGT